MNSASATVSPPADPGIDRVWQWLAERFPRPIAPSTGLAQAGIDSLDWLELTVEIERRFGVRLSGASISRMQTIGDLLQEVAARASEPLDPSAVPSPLEVPELFLGEEARYWLRRLERAELAAAWSIYALNWLLIRFSFRLKVCGRENLPRRTPFLLAPHHVSYLDSFVLAAALDFALLRQTYWAAWTGVAFGPLFRLLRRLTHVVPVDAARGAASSLAYGAAVLRGGQNLVWFPEGKLSRSGDVVCLKPGIGILLAHYPVPVVPVRVEGTHEALPPGRILPRPGAIQIIFDPPLDPLDLATQGSGAQASERITSALHAEMVRRAGQ